MVLLFMVLREDTIGQTFLLPKDIRTLIPDDHVCFFIEKIVNCVDFSEIDFSMLILLVRRLILLLC